MHGLLDGGHSSNGGGPHGLPVCCQGSNTTHSGGSGASCPASTGSGGSGIWGAEEQPPRPSASTMSSAMIAAAAKCQITRERTPSQGLKIRLIPKPFFDLSSIFFSFSFRPFRSICDHSEGTVHAGGRLPRRTDETIQRGRAELASTRGDLGSGFHRVARSTAPTLRVNPYRISPKRRRQGISRGEDLALPGVRHLTCGRSRQLPLGVDSAHGYRDVRKIRQSF